jgi:hypothetical protein
MRRKLYIDIDGVLLNLKKATKTEYSVPFINYIKEAFDCYWLTTHCKGQNATALKYLSTYFDALIIEKLKVVKPTNWTTLKTEGIDFSADFLWLEDYPFQSEIKILKESNCFHKLIQIDLNKPDQLKRVAKILSDEVVIKRQI